MDELRGFGEDFMGTVLFAKNFEHRKCTHAGTISVPAAQCIKELIGKRETFHLFTNWVIHGFLTSLLFALCSVLSGNSNSHSYIVATQDAELRSYLRQIPGVPLLYIKYNQIILEPISEATKIKIEQVLNTIYSFFTFIPTKGRITHWFMLVGETEAYAKAIWTS
jgi:U3 small nucleolar RNA-associated protein 23